jgi:nitrogen fixation protein NifU and related proteins
MNNIDSIYNEHILELAKNLESNLPKEEDLIGYAITKYNNPACGDNMLLYIKLSDEGGEGKKIEDIRVCLDGCVISKASTKLLLESIRGKSLSEVSKLMPYDMHNMLGVNVGEMRAPCVLTPYYAMRKYLENI